MDSLTQIVLGASVGEAALGRKVGNRAMVWGAIAGTIPDLDVISNGFMSPIDALAFHRGPTHSALYLTLFALILGWCVHFLYTLKWHKWLGIIGWSMLILATSGAIAFMGQMSLNKGLIAAGILCGAGFLVFKRYFRASYDSPTASVRDWQWMFFLSLVTHPILDCFTTYGTQILIPFSGMRVAFNNIAVADPIYTVPFLICLLVAMGFNKSNKRRRFWNNIGLIISSIYMIFTIFNKFNINTIFEKSLQANNISYSRYMTTPTILNNILWTGIAESDTTYFYGTYSYFDAEPLFEIKSIGKNRETFATDLENDSTLKTLRWFSDDYFQLKQKSGDTLEYYDLRFGTFKMKASDPDQFVFKFNLYKDPASHYILKDQGERPRDANFGEAFAALWNRIMGRK